MILNNGEMDMKCDELQYEYLGKMMSYFPCSTLVIRKQFVEAAIDEMKDKINQKDFFWDGCGFSKMGFKNTIDVANYIDELKKERDFLAKDRSLAYRDLEDRTQENMKLKAENEKLNTRLSESAMKVYKHHNKQTLRALWLARALRAEAAYLYWNDLAFHKIYGIVKFNVKRDCGENIKPNQKVHTPYTWADIWDDVRYECTKKAEEFK